jgi:hypothetical protein
LKKSDKKKFRHSGAGRNPDGRCWIPACAGMTTSLGATFFGRATRADR